MAKKIWYSKPLSNIWNQYNSFYNQTKGTPKQFYSEKNNQILSSQFLPHEKLQIETNILDLWKLDVSKEFIHLYFQTNELKRFLSDLRLADIDGIVSFMFESGEAHKMAASMDGVSPLNSPIKVQTYSFGIHVPYEKEEKGFAFQLMYINEKEIKLIWSVGQNEGWCSAETYKKNQLDTESDAKFYATTFRLAINTLAYMKAFPECVKEGVPKTEESECAYILELSEKVLESTIAKSSGKILSPHFRKGYFKKLQSDFYVHKKGQIVFVHETMVKGKAKTVEKSDNKGKLDDFKKN
jgi:hypothetical protein